MTNRSRSPIPIISDIEALEHARKCVSAMAEDREGDSLGPIDSRALSELDRLIDFAKNQSHVGLTCEHGRAPGFGCCGGTRLRGGKTLTDAEFALWCNKFKQCGYCGSDFYGPSCSCEIKEQG